METSYHQSGAINFVADFLIPVIVAAVTYFLISKLDDWKKRWNYSRLGVDILRSLMEEVGGGIEIMRKASQPNSTEIPNPLPRRSWNGMTTIPDDVLLRILALSKKAVPIGFPINEIRSHCKNYFDHMCPNWDVVPKAGAQWKTVIVRFSNYPKAAKGVFDMLKQAKDLLEKNSKRLWPK